MHLLLVGLPQGDAGLVFSFILFVFHLPFIFVYFYNTHQVLVGLPQWGWWPCYFVLFYFILLYFHNTNQVLVGLPQGVGGIAILFSITRSIYSFNSIFKTRTRCP
jgi:hypothetical protein